ncbi:MAG: hydantoinase B/oxoprolinase family protein, partial [Gaiellales bacterium]
HYGLFPPRGLAGGGDAAPTELRIATSAAELDPRERDPSLASPIKFSGLEVRPGEKIVVRTPGGGGYGPVESRDVAAVREDLKNGYISREAATETYGLDADEAAAIVERHSWPDRVGSRRAR